jgi:glycosyltransferase involved in cell wall biosynthesis
MKIAYDPQIFSAQVYGGISRYFCEIAPRIAKEPGVQITIAAPMYINAYLDSVPRSLVTGFRAPNAMRLSLMLRGLGMLIGDLMLRASAPDIVHETYYFPFRLGPRRARRVLTIYDMIHEKFASDSPQSERTARYKALAAERADHVICISEATRRDAIEILGLVHEKTSVVYLGFDLMTTDKNSTEKLVSTTGAPFLLYVGNRGGHKNYHRLLEAYATSPLLSAGYRLVCFGGGPFRTEEKKMIQELGLNSDQVMQLAGDDQLLGGYYERASAFVYPSLYAAIERVVGSADHRNALIAKGRARLKLFSWDRCARETLEIYMKLA